MTWVSQFDATPGGVVDRLPSISAELDMPGRWTPIAGVRSDAGERINAKSALGLGPLWQGINLLAGDVGQLPFRKMVRTGRETRKDAGHAADRLVRVAPNEYQTPSLWKETMMLYALLWGNGISGIVRRGGRPAGLTPFLPDRTGFEKQGDGSYMIFTEINGRQVAVLPADTIHIRGLASNGFWGLSIVEYLQGVIGHGIALQKHGNAVFRNGAKPSGFIKSKSKLTPESRKNLRVEWNQMHQGADSAGKVGLLTGDMDFVTTAMSNVEAQWLDAVRLSREFMASILGIPAFKLNSLENSSVRANLEEQNRDYYNTSLSRWTNRFAEECRRKLLTETEAASGDHFFKWFPEGFLRSDIEKRYKAYSLGRAGEWLSANDVRELEDMNAIDGGDEYVNPAINTKDATAEREVRDLIASRVDAMLAAESAAVQREARSARNYTEWLDGFYGRFASLAAAHLEKSCDVAAAVGITANWREASETYARRQLAAMLDVAGANNREQLPQSVAASLADAGRRAAGLTTAILRGNDG